MYKISKFNEKVTIARLLNTKDTVRDSVINHE